MNQAITKGFIYSFLALIVLAIHCHPAIADQPKGQTMRTTKYPVFKSAQEIVEFLRIGWGTSDFDKSKTLPNLLIGNRRVIKYFGQEVVVGDRLSPEAVKVLGDELATTDSKAMRDEIIYLLDDLRRLTTPGNELRDPDIIALLFGPGFARPDGARDNAIELLAKHASAASLQRYNHVIMQALRDTPDTYVLQLVAKAKPPEAREELKDLSWLSKWNEPNSTAEIWLRIARAALGDTAIEEDYIARAKRTEAEGDAEKLRGYLNSLARIGTPRTLRAICMRLRSPLVIEQGGGYIQLVRIEAMKSLHYAYPGETAFEISSINERMFDRAEEFCTRTLGVDFKGMPRPEFNY